MESSPNDENKNSERRFFGRIQNGVYVSLYYIFFIVVVTFIGVFLFDYWFLLVIIVVAFVIEDGYFREFVDYERSHVKIPLLNRNIDNEFAILFVYFIGILLAVFMANVMSTLLTLFKPIIHNVLAVLTISVFATSLVVVEIKSHLRKK